MANKFYVHNDIFRYQDEVFGDSDTEPPEGMSCLSPSYDFFFFFFLNKFVVGIVSNLRSCLS